MKRSVIFYSLLIFIISFISCSNPSNIDSKTVTSPTPPTSEKNETDIKKEEDIPSAPNNDKKGEVEEVDPKEDETDKTPSVPKKDDNNNPPSILDEEKSELEKMGVSIEKTELVYEKLKDKSWILKQGSTSGEILFSNITFSNNIQGIITANIQNNKIDIALNKYNVVCYVDDSNLSTIKNKLMGVTIIDKGTYFEFLDAKNINKTYLLEVQSVNKEFTQKVNNDIASLLNSSWTQMDNDNKLFKEGLSISFKYDMDTNVLKTNIIHKAINESYMKVEELLDNKEFYIEDVKKKGNENLDSSLLASDKTYELALDIDRLVLAEIKPNIKTLAIFGRN